MMEKQFEITKAVEADLEEVVALYGDLCDYLATLEVNPCNWTRDRNPTRATAERWLAEDVLYVLRADGRLMATMALPDYQPEGYGRADWQVRAEPGELLVVSTVATHPAAAGRGCATKLVAYAKEEGRRRGCKVLRLDVCDINEGAIRVYERAGFTCVSRYNLFDREPPYHLYRLYEFLL